MCGVLNWLRKIYRTYGCTPWLPCISHRLVNTTSVKSLTASNGLASPLLRLRYITLLSSWVYGSSSSSWTNHSTLKKPFLRYSHPLICSFVYLWYVLTKRIPQVLQHQTHFFTVIFGIILPKASIITGILANIYLVLILLGLREDTRFFYTYYPYVAIFYLFYLASFRSSESSKTQKILCFLFITITILCLILIGKRVINEPVLWLNTIYVSAFNLIFLVHNVYSLVKGLKPSVHTTVMALALGTVLLTPFIGYTTYREFVTYTKVDGEWHASLPIAATFDPNFTDYGTPYVPVDDLKSARYKPNKRQTRRVYQFSMLCLHQRLSLLQDTINTLKTSS